MTIFELTFGLTSLILGLALTHMASALYKLAQAGGRVRWAPEPLLQATIVLLVIVIRNFRMNHWWIGDAFVEISTSVVFRGFLVILSWILNNFWSLREFCFASASRHDGRSSASR